MSINLSFYQLGLLRNNMVVLTEHCPDWARAFLAVSADMKQFLEPLEIALHHIGSTAIAHTRAKPILDILGVVDSIEMLDNAQASFEEYGLIWKGENGIAGRRYCAQYDEAQEKTYMHLHMFEKGHPAISDHLVFRDYLRACPAVAKKYDAEKGRLMDAYANDRSLYVLNKTNFIENILREAHQWQQEKMS